MTCLERLSDGMNAAAGPFEDSEVAAVHTLTTEDPGPISPGRSAEGPCHEWGTVGEVSQ